MEISNSCASMLEPPSPKQGDSLLSSTLQSHMPAETTYIWQHGPFVGYPAMIQDPHRFQLPPTQSGTVYPNRLQLPPTQSGTLYPARWVHTLPSHTASQRCPPTTMGAAFGPAEYIRPQQQHSDRTRSLSLDANRLLPTSQPRAQAASAVDNAPAEQSCTGVDGFQSFLPHVTRQDQQEAGQSPLYICRLCQIKFATRAIFEVHMARHSVTAKFRCPACGELLSSQYSLQKHRQTYPNNECVDRDSLYQCTICHKQLSCKRTLDMHRTKQHPDVLDGLHAPEMEANEDQAVTHTLPNSMQKISTNKKKKSGRTHREKNKKERMRTKMIYKSEYKAKPASRPACEFCGRTFSTEFILQKHYLVHTNYRPLRCDVCGRTFRDKGNLRIHFMSHTGEKPHKCSECPAAFIRRDFLAHHMKLHTKEGLFTCQVCGKVDIREYDAACHMRSHTGERRYACKQCDKTFRWRGDLSAHVKTHTGEFPAACDLCNKKYPNRKILRVHYMSHTKGVPFACADCSKRFTYKKELEMHLMTSNSGMHGCAKCSLMFVTACGFYQHARTHDEDKYTPDNLLESIKMECL